MEIIEASDSKVTTGSREFLTALRLEVENHSGVNHPLLGRLSGSHLTRDDFLVLGLQHYPLVGTFTTYLEHLLLRGPDSNAKQWIAKVLIDEYGEGSDGKDHAELYREFLTSCGAMPGQELETPLHPTVPAFIEAHLRLVTREPFLVGLGALGPGHEWSIPKMFPPIIDGLRRAGFGTDEILYFDLHCLQDVDHGRWLEEALARFASVPANQILIRRGALLSLEARATFWGGVEDKLRTRRAGTTGEARPDGAPIEAREITLRELRAKQMESRYSFA